LARFPNKNSDLSWSDPGAMFRKDARINIRPSSKDLRGLQKKALAEGIPYQTLVASILHKYVEGRLHEDR